eukprot:1468107-Prymnesium_polylepis.1
MNFGTVDGRLFAGDASVSKSFGVGDAPILSQMGRIVMDFDQLVGEVVVFADPNVSLMAQRVGAAINRGSGRPGMRVDAETGALSLEHVLLTGLRPTTIVVCWSGVVWCWSSASRVRSRLRCPSSTYLYAEWLRCSRATRRRTPNSAVR